MSFLGATRVKGLTILSGCQPLNVLGDLFLSELAYCARASISHPLLDN